MQLLAEIASATAHVIIPRRYRPIGYLTHLTQCRTGLTVQKGPFVGMKYVSSSQGSCYIPKLLGIYERELYEIIDSIIQTATGLVDIGAAEGYYAVGVAYKAPNTRVVAFEESELGRLLLREMAHTNHVTERVEIRGRCELADLRQVLQEMPGATVICDVEGFEKELLDPLCVPELQASSILVEMHDFLQPGTTELIHQRFEKSHTILEIAQTGREIRDYPFRTVGTSLMPSRYITWAVSEWRPVPMHWLFLQASGRPVK